MKFRSLLPLLVSLMAASVLYGQSNTIVDQLLNQKEALYAETAYLALVGGGRIEESATPADAYAKAAESGWLTANSAPDKPMTVRSLSFLLMKVFGLGGGVMYSILPTDHFAYREMVAWGVINGSGGPDRMPSGEEVVISIGKAAALIGGAK